MKTKIEVDIPNGYEFVRWGRATLGELYIGCHGLVEEWKVNIPTTNFCVIVCEIKKWVPANPSGFKQFGRAKFSDNQKDWVEGELYGISFVDEEGTGWRYCKVLEEE